MKQQWRLEDSSGHRFNVTLIHCFTDGHYHSTSKGGALTPPPQNVGWIVPIYAHAPLLLGVSPFLLEE